jgi:hypothetical protein
MPRRQYLRIFISEKRINMEAYKWMNWKTGVPAPEPIWDAVIIPLDLTVPNVHPRS